MLKKNQRFNATGIAHRKDVAAALDKRPEKEKAVLEVKERCPQIRSSTASLPEETMLLRIAISIICQYLNMSPFLLAFFWPLYS